ncbi:MAG: LacI family transcriptional regulator [Lachnospiraceae bacterium]|nr:LacI family transcriptional regulator [Lachnospiraceae bacterium]
MNIYDIAEEAGVSIATVSRVLHNSDKVSKSTKEKVMAIIDRNDYRPNVFAQGLGSDSMHTIGILVPDIADQYMASAFSALEKLLVSYGYDCILGCSGYDAVEKEKHLKLLLEKRIDAIILVGSTYAGSEDETHNTDYILEAAGEKPIFIINGIIEGKNIYCTATYDEKAVYDVTSALVKKGRRKILFLTDSRSYAANHKKIGFEQALKEASLMPDPELIIHTQNNVHTVSDLLNERDLDFDAVIATDDGMAIGALKYALKKGLRVPEDLDIIGYNNSSICEVSAPELTSIDNKVEKVCSITIDRLIRVLNGETDVPSCEMIHCDLVHRETS